MIFNPAPLAVGRRLGTRSESPCPSNPAASLSSMVVFEATIPCTADIGDVALPAYLGPTSYPWYQLLGLHFEYRPVRLSLATLIYTTALRPRINADTSSQGHFGRFHRRFFCSYLAHFCSCPRHSKHETLFGWMISGLYDLDFSTYLRFTKCHVRLYRAGWTT